MRKYLKWFIFLLCFIITLLIVFLILGDNNLKFDTKIYNYIISYKSDFWTMFFKEVTFFASVGFMIFITVVCMFLPNFKVYKYVIMVNMICDVVINNLIKILVRRQRPLEWFLVSESGYSFPSGHTMAAVCFYGLLIYLLYVSNVRKTYKIVGIMGGVILVFLIGVSRIYLGVHYASDVIGGMVIALMYLIIFVTVINGKTLKKG